MTDQPRAFILERDTDLSGVSGTGTVAWGVAFPDGVVALRWNSDWPTSVVFHDRGMEAVEAVHGHSGSTRVVWVEQELAPAPAPEVQPSPPPQPVQGNGDLPGNTIRPSYVPADAQRIFLADARTGKLAPMGVEASGGLARVEFEDGWFVISLHPGDMAAGIKSRTEIKAYPRNVPGIDLSRGRHVTVFDQRFPRGYLKATTKTQRGEVIVMQMHGPNTGTTKYQGPILSMRTDDGRLEIVHQHYRDSSKTWQPGPIYSEPIEEGVSNRWGIETFFAERNGMIRIRKNGKILKEVPGYTYNEGVRSWLGPKFGVYDVVYQPVTIHYGNIAVYKLRS